MGNDGPIPKAESKFTIVQNIRRHVTNKSLLISPVRGGPIIGSDNERRFPRDDRPIRGFR